MPKNPHPPRHSGSSKNKKSAPPPPGAEDTSFIVFSNAKGDPKKGKKTDNPAKDDANDKGKGKAKSAPDQPEDAPKKPDTRTLIGGASWTGKLPVNMLSEHCQKQKWDKPEYTMVVWSPIRLNVSRLIHLQTKVKGGFVSHVILKATNTKTRESISLPPIRLPVDQQELAVQPTALEARHFAATYTLYRIANMKNIHMMMPPTYRDLWKGPFADMKKDDVKSGKGWMYEADPFVAHKEREQAKAEADKKRDEAAKLREKEKNQSTGGVGGPSSGGGNIMRGWTRVPKIDMGKRIRAEIERLIRRDAVWNPHSVNVSLAQRSALIDEITKLGFRKSHVEEAAEICKDREEILEWLLIHVPEDDLPSWSLPEGYTAGISMASGNLKREAALKRLAATGYAVELCEEALDSFSGDEAKAASLLQARLLGDDELAEQLSNTVIADADEEDFWAEEQVILASIYDERYSTDGADQCQIRLEVSDGTKTEFILNSRKPAGLYPNVLPIISINAKIPAYIRLSIIRQALNHARESFIGEQMIFNIVDWLEHEIPAIITNPGRLTDVSSAISAADTGVHAEEVKQKEKRHRRARPVNLRPGSPVSQRMLEQWRAKRNSSEQQRMLRAREKLPAWQLQEDIVDAVDQYQVVIISGETGSGKSTQSVQFILDDMIQRQLGEAANIVCTQPRRISALGLADRVADERCTAVGDEVGYSIRGESRQKPGVTKLTFMTTGVLLRRLQTSGGTPDDVVACLADITHVVVDEVHERSLDTDFLLVLLRDVLKKRKDLRVILMSATLDAEVFANYFEPAVGKVGMIEIQGRTHPVTDYYVDDVIRMSGFNGHSADEDWEDEESQKNIGGTLRSIGMRINYDLIAQTVHFIDAQLGAQDGAILIFLPGTMEIDRTLQVSCTHAANTIRPLLTKCARLFARCQIFTHCLSTHHCSQLISVASSHCLRKGSGRSSRLPMWPRPRLPLKMSWL